MSLDFESLRRSAVQYMERELSAQAWRGCDLYTTPPLRQLRMEVDRLAYGTGWLLDDPTLLKGDFYDTETIHRERLEGLEYAIRSELKLLAHGKTKRETERSTVKVPADPISHVLEWLAGRKHVPATLRNYLSKFVRHKEIATYTHTTTTHRKLFLPPYPIRNTDSVYVTWMGGKAEEQA